MKSFGNCWYFSRKILLSRGLQMFRIFSSSISFSASSLVIRPFLVSNFLQRRSSLAKRIMFGTRVNVFIFSAACSLWMMRISSYSDRTKFPVIIFGLPRSRGESRCNESLEPRAEPLDRRAP